MNDRETPAWVKLDSGAVWPRPALESDEHYGPAHRATYSPDSLTRGDLLYLASIASAYGQLVTVPTAAKALPALRRALRASLVDPTTPTPTEGDQG